MIDTYNDGAPSTRYRGLVDLVLIANTQQPDAAALRSALLSQYSAPSLTAPTSIELPDETWIAGYSKEIEPLPSVAQRTAVEAIDLVKALLEPLLDDAAMTGTWKPQLRTWS